MNSCLWWWWWYKTLCETLVSNDKKWVLPNFALIMSESVAKIDFHQKNSLSTMSFFANPGWVKWYPLKQTKSKNKHHFSIPTFRVIQLYFLGRKNSSTPKVLKIHVVPGWSVNKERCIFNLQCSLSCGIFLDQKAKLYNSKSWYRKVVFVFWFCLF